LRCCWVTRAGCYAGANATYPHLLQIVIAAEGLATPYVLSGIEDFSGADTPWTVPFACAAVWAPLSASIIVPNMLTFMESGFDKAGRLILTSAPLEASLRSLIVPPLLATSAFLRVLVIACDCLGPPRSSSLLQVSTALLTEGVLYEVIVAPSKGLSVAQQLEYLPVNIFGTVLYGAAFAIAYAAYVRARQAPLVSIRERSIALLAKVMRSSLLCRRLQTARLIGKAEPVEPLLVWLCVYLLCYTTSYDNVNTPHLVGYFSALCMAILTQVNLS
jgi:hypothetical protein